MAHITRIAWQPVFTSWNYLYAYACSNCHFSVDTIQWHAGKLFYCTECQEPLEYLLIENNGEIVKFRSEKPFIQPHIPVVMAPNDREKNESVGAGVVVFTLASFTTILAVMIAYY